MSERDDFLQFDPHVNTKPWATYCHRRGQSWKMHPRRAQALNCFSVYADLARIYCWNNTEARWDTVATKDFASKHSTCDHCGGSTMDPAIPGPKYPLWHNAFRAQPTGWDSGDFLWLRRSRKIIEPIKMMFLCKRCAAFLA